MCKVGQRIGKSGWPKTPLQQETWNFVCVILDGKWVKILHSGGKYRIRYRSPRQRTAVSGNHIELHHPRHTAPVPSLPTALYSVGAVSYSSRQVGRGLC